ncbi:N-acetylmuramoyl-L-alanine amidase [Flavicella sp.]|uniref:N-acetylmuramoyl-L-alanine amidase family protein n=1 Tax=Flavicella sp. TaxID=2957742 RepID=UPI0030192BF2
MFLQIFYFSSAVNSQEKTFTVVLDAGHGGKDPGKVAYKKYKEKEIALDIVLLIGKNLKKEQNVKVIYTRKKDVFVNLWERGRIANKADADLFVSVHCNAHNSQASGSETWVLGLHANKRNFEVAKAENEVILLEDNYQEKYKGFDPSSPESMIGLTLEQEESLDESISLASSVQKIFQGTLKRTNRGVKQAGFAVLHQTYMPSILIEMGFISNKKEGAYLNSNKGKNEMASAISKAISKHIEGVRLNTVSTVNIIESVAQASVENSKTPYFKVQIASGKKKISTASYNFKGLKAVNRVPVGEYYKYYLGHTENYKEAKLLLKKAKKAGYKSSFIAAFVDNERIALSKAIK